MTLQTSTQLELIPKKESLDSIKGVECACISHHSAWKMSAVLCRPTETRKLRTKSSTTSSLICGPDTAQHRSVYTDTW